LNKSTEKTEELLGFKTVIDNIATKEESEKNESGKNQNI
jgi:hypothetical protein